MKKLSKIFTLAVVMVFFSLDVIAALTKFENDIVGWQSAVSDQSITIDFESISGSTLTPINGDEFSSNSGNPIFSSIDQSGVFVGNPALSQIPNPPSGVNMMSPACTPSCEGVIRVSFNTPVNAIGAIFVDVEADFSLTGFALNLDASIPDVSFSSNQGQGSFSFLGLTSDTPFNDIDIHFTTGPNIDGTLIDNLSYSLVPIPGAFLLFISGLGLFVKLSRKS